MRYGIFGDIHSNLEAFQEVIKSYKEEKIDEFICAGDVVGYGADPERCIQELKNLNAKSVCGNHDWASVGLFNIDYFNYAAKGAVEWTQKILSRDEKKFLKSLDLIIDEDDFSIVHGSLDRPDFFYYIMNVESAYGCFRKMQHNLCFIGHSHVPVVFFTEGNEIRYTFDNFVRIKEEVKYIINVGSVGQPRDGNPNATFSIYDSDKMTVEIRRIKYDIETAKDKILKAGLPEILGYRLLKGR